MHAVRTRHLLFACTVVLALAACRSDEVEGPPPDATALPQGAAPPQTPSESPTDNTPTPATDPAAAPPTP